MHRALNISSVIVIRLQELNRLKMLLCAIDQIQSIFHFLFESAKRLKRKRILTEISYFLMTSFFMKNLVRAAYNLKQIWLFSEYFVFRWKMKCYSLKKIFDLIYHHLESILSFPFLECDVEKMMIRFQKISFDSHCYFSQIEMRKFFQTLYESIENRFHQSLSSVNSMNNVHIHWNHVFCSISCWRDLIVCWHWSTMKTCEKILKMREFFTKWIEYFFFDEINEFCLYLFLIFACSHRVIYCEAAHGAFLCDRFCWISNFHLFYRVLFCAFERILKLSDWDCVSEWFDSLACDIQNFKFNISRIWYTLFYFAFSFSFHYCIYYTIEQNKNVTNYHFEKKIFEQKQTECDAQKKVWQWLHDKNIKLTIWFNSSQKIDTWFQIDDEQIEIQISRILTQIIYFINNYLQHIAKCNQIFQNRNRFCYRYEMKNNFAKNWKENTVQHYSCKCYCKSCLRKKLCVKLELIMQSLRFTFFDVSHFCFCIHDWIIERCTSDCKTWSWNCRSQNRKIFFSLIR